MIESDGWHDIPLSPEVNTPEKRFSATLNVINNGGETLTVLIMPPFREFWTSFSQINSRLYQRAGLFLNPSTTKHHLVATIEPIGAAARSTIDDHDWSLTLFGIALRPALIFAWQRLLKQGLDGMEVLGSTSVGRRLDTGDQTSRAPDNRARLLLALRDAGVTYQEALRETIGRVSSRRIDTHVKRLADAGLVTKKAGLNAGKGEDIKYEIAEGDPLKWPAYKDSNGRLRIKASEMLKKAIRKLSAKGDMISHLSAMKRLVADCGVNENYAGYIASFGLQFYSQQGLLIKDKEQLTEIQLTDSGLAVVTDILEPLQRWSSDRWSVEEINRIGARFTSHPYEYGSLFRQIARSYREHSPYINKDAEEKLDLVLRMIRENPGITQADIYQKTNSSKSHIIFFVKYLGTSGYIIQTKVDKGNRIFLYPVDMPS